jgi:hypothetical protein
MLPLQTYKHTTKNFRRVNDNRIIIGKMNRIPDDINSRSNNRHGEYMCMIVGAEEVEGKKMKGRTQITDIFPFVIQ